MAPVEEINEKTDKLLAEVDSSDDEKEETPTIIATNFTQDSLQDSSATFPLGQMTQGGSQASIYNPISRVATHNRPVLSHLSAETGWESSGFTQLDQMLRTQSQAQQVAYPVYPPHLPGILFGHQTFQVNNTTAEDKATTATAKLATKKAPTKKGGTAKPKKDKTDGEKKKKTRGPAFKDPEAFALLDIIERRNTIAGRVNWELVCAAMENAGWPKRGVEATKRRYWEIVGKATKMPTGDPDVPKLLLRAREVHYLIRCNNGVGDPSEELAAVEGDILEVTAGATGVRLDQVLGDDSDVESNTPALKTPTQKSFVSRRVSTSTSKSSVFDAVAQMQAAQMEETRRLALEEKAEARRIRQEERKERDKQNKLWLKLGAMAVAAFLGNTGDQESKSRLQNDLLQSIINVDDSDSDEDDSITAFNLKKRHI